VFYTGAAMRKHPQATKGLLGQTGLKPVRTRKALAAFSDFRCAKGIEHLLLLQDKSYSGLLK
jgi:hypothetical protein